MNHLSRKLTTIALLSLLTAPAALLAADMPDSVHDSHRPAQAQAAATAGKAAPDQWRERRDQMEARMRAMQQTTDPQARQSMMLAQMQDMQEMMQGMSAGCPMMGGAGNGGMMGGKSGMSAK